MVERWVAQGGGECPILETFSARLDEALSILIYWKVSLFIAGGLEKTTFKRSLSSETILSFCGVINDFVQSC